MQYVVYSDTFTDAPPGVTEEELCFKCYQPTALALAADAAAAAGSEGAAAAAGSEPPAAADVRLYDGQRRRYKYFHTRCLATLPEEKRVQIIATNDPWGGT